MPNTQIIILAGGKGTRMCSDSPKVLCRINNIPMVKYLLNQIKEVCEKPTIVIGYKGEDVIKELGEGYNYVWQYEQLGTGHAVICAKEKLIDSSENVIVLLGDHPLVRAKTIKDLIEYHKNSKPILTLSTIVAPNFYEEFERFYHYGRIIRKENGDVEKIIEVKDATEEQRQIHEVNASYYCFDADWLWGNIEKLENKNASGEFYLTDMVGLAVQQGKKVNAFVVENPIEGFGANTIKELEEMERYLR